MKAKAISLIKNVIRFLKFAVRVLVGVLHAATGTRHKKNCECENIEKKEEQ